MWRINWRHNVRIMWLETRAPVAAKTLAKIEKGAATKPALKEAMEASGAALAELIADAENGGKLNVTGQKVRNNLLAGESACPTKTGQSVQQRQATKNDGLPHLTSPGPHGRCRAPAPPPG